MIPEPPPYQLASIGTYDPETTGALGARSVRRTVQLNRAAARFPGGQPQAQGRSPGDAAARGRDAAGRGTRDLTPGRVKTVSFPRPADADAGDANASEVPIAEQPASYAVASLQPESPPRRRIADSEGENNAAVRLGRLYFGNTHRRRRRHHPALAGGRGGADRGAARPRSGFQALGAGVAIGGRFQLRDDVGGARRRSDGRSRAGETVAAKGEVTGAGKRPKTPAERLNLDAKQRAKSEKCLAEAVYFESRGEVKRGQIAVAQVVMNRVFSGFYPNNVCGVVYQNAHRKLACQFTFACDGIPDKIEEPDMWEQAKEIARDMLDGKLWLPEIGHSTHYHAYWVHPSWVNEMRKLYKIGVHSFYRPRAWGDTVEVPNHPFVAPADKRSCNQISMSRPTSSAGAECVSAPDEA